MQRFYLDRESYGPEFDDRLIRLVRENPAIYDVNHEHYRRNPVRVAIWERIATELRAPSKFLQTKWKNIRYNYLQEIKCLETGHTNSNIRKRRFTEDLSFLQHTAQTYKKTVQKNSYNSSDNDNDNDSNSYMYPDPHRANAYEVIEIEHSDDGSQPEFEADCALQPPVRSEDDIEDDDKLLVEATLPTAASDAADALQPEVTIEERRALCCNSKTQPLKAEDNLMATPKLSPSRYPSNPSSPLLTPLVMMGNGQGIEQNGNEITIEPIPKQAKAQPQNAQRTARHNAIATTEQACKIMANAVKRKSMPAPFPVLTPINDPIELYCLSLVDSLRNMPRSERERVKYEFAKILKDAKYKDQS